MITKSELQKANEKLMAESREHLGEPPTAEQLRAYSRGELAESEEERIREFLAAYPELAASLVVPFPTEGAEPGDPDYLSDAEYPAHWAAMQQRMSSHPVAQPERVLRFHRRLSFALAAMLVLAFGGILLQAQSNRRLAHELASPRIAFEERILSPDGRRGMSDEFTPLDSNGNAYLLRPSLVNADPYPSYRAEILDASASSPHVLWNAPSIPRHEDDSFAILVPREFLSSGGRYRIVLYGLDAGGHESRLATYGVRVP
jgi:hypothetical protein